MSRISRSSSLTSRTALLTRWESKEWARLVLSELRPPSPTLSITLLENVCVTFQLQSTRYSGDYLTVADGRPIRYPDTDSCLALGPRRSVELFPFYLTVRRAAAVPRPKPNAASMVRDCSAPVLKPPASKAPALPQSSPPVPKAPASPPGPQR